MRTLVIGLSNDKRRVYLKTSISQLNWDIEDIKKNEKWYALREIGYEAIKQIIDADYVRPLLGKYDKNSASFTFEIEFFD